VRDRELGTLSTVRERGREGGKEGGREGGGGGGVKERERETSLRNNVHRVYGVYPLSTGTQNSKTKIQQKFQQKKFQTNPAYALQLPAVTAYSKHNHQLFP